VSPGGSLGSIYVLQFLFKIIIKQQPLELGEKIRTDLEALVRILYLLINI
jgi:hypothetical protein